MNWIITNWQTVITLCLVPLPYIVGFALMALEIMDWGN